MLEMAHFLYLSRIIAYLFLQGRLCCADGWAGFPCKQPAVPTTTTAADTTATTTTVTSSTKRQTHYKRHKPTQSGCGTCDWSEKCSQQLTQPADQHLNVPASPQPVHHIQPVASQSVSYTSPGGLFHKAFSVYV